MGRFIYWSEDADIDDHKFWFGTQSSEDITAFGGQEDSPQQIEWHWTYDEDYKPLCLQIKSLKRRLKAKWGISYTQAMKRQDPEWCRSDESKGLTSECWELVAKIDLGLKIKKGLENTGDELYCTADYY